MFPNRLKAAALALLALVPLAGPTPAQAEPLARLLFLGDSLTAGFGLDAEHSLVSQAQDVLRARGLDVETIQGGVSGDTTAAGAARAAWTRPSGTTHAVVFLGGNDMLRGLDPRRAQDNLITILQTYQDIPVLLVGLQAPGNLGPDEVALWAEVYETVARSRDRVWFVPDASAPLRSGNRVNTRLMLSDGIHPNAAGVEAVTEGLTPCLIELLTQWEPSDRCAPPAG